jgi:hypothetical protein
MVLDEHQEAGKELARDPKGNIVGRKKKLNIFRLSTCKVKRKGKAIPVTGHAGP